MDTPHNMYLNIIEKVRKAEGKETVDLSLEEDLSLAVMNLVSIEEHMYFTGIKTKKPDYFDLLDEVREVRKELLGKMISTHEGETWCISKHLLAATMRMIEVGTKYHSSGNKEKAERMYDLGSKIYALFWALRLKLLEKTDVKKISNSQLNVHDSNAPKKPWSYEDIVKKLVNCCNE